MRIYFLIRLNLLMGEEEKHLFLLFYELSLRMKFTYLRCVQTFPFSRSRLTFSFPEAIYNPYFFVSSMQTFVLHSFSF